MKLLTIWFGDVGTYWGHLLGLLLIGIAVIFFLMYSNYQAIEGEKQSDTVSSTLQKISWSFCQL